MTCTATGSASGHVFVRRTDYRREGRRPTKILDEGIQLERRRRAKLRDSRPASQAADRLLLLLLRHNTTEKKGKKNQSKQMAAA